MTKMSLYKVELRLQKLEEFTYEAIDQLSSLKNLLLQHQQQQKKEQQMQHPLSHTARSSRQNIKEASLRPSFLRSSFRNRTITVGGGIGSIVTSLNVGKSNYLHQNNHSFPGKNNTYSRLFNHSLSNIETSTGHSTITEFLKDAETARLPIASSRKRFQSEMQEYKPKSKLLDDG